MLEHFFLFYKLSLKFKKSCITVNDEKIAAELLEINYYDIRKLHNNMIIMTYNIFIIVVRLLFYLKFTHTHPSPLFTGLVPTNILAFSHSCFFCALFFMYVNIHKKLGNPLIFQQRRPPVEVE